LISANICYIVVRPYSSLKQNLSLVSERVIWSDEASAFLVRAEWTPPGGICLPLR